MKAYELIADTIADQGVGAVFGLLGDGNMLLLAALVDRHGVRLVNARHENAAVTMADGYARASGRLGVCSVTCGPGLTQVTTALTAAVRNRTPLVVIAGDVPVGMAWNPQRTDQGLVTAAAGARFAPICALSMIVPTITEAFAVAERDRLPVVVSIPYDLQELEVEAAAVRPGRPAPIPARPRTAPSSADVTAAADRLARAERPILLAGRGAVESNARPHTLGLAARIGALLGTTLLARDWFRGETFDLGLVGGLSSRTTRELIAESDVVLAVGASLGYFATDNGALLRGKDVIQVDLDPPGISEGVRGATSYVRGDAAAAVDAIEATLAERGHQREGFRTVETAARLATPLPEYPTIQPEPGTVDPAAVIAALDAALPSDALVVYGVGHFWSFAVMGLHRQNPADHLHAYGFGAVGQGLATAIGAAVATGRQVVLVEGDGSLMMHLAELATIEVEALELLIVVMNDGGYGSEIHKLNFKGVDGELARFGRNDFAAIARGFGIASNTVTDPGEVGDLVATHASRRGPTLLDVPMAKDAISAPTRRALFPHTIPAKEV